jgi:hypothetical protein
MSIDFSAALRQEQEQKFRSELVSAIKSLSEQIKSLEAKVDALAGKKAKADLKE